SFYFYKYMQYIFLDQLLKIRTELFAVFLRLFIKRLSFGVKKC
ncbi:MAG: hypothetical protein PWQ12_1575, partial [Clostridiales bacterium]|nr:hypothetical protein [Clostridiales bacterium]